MDEGENFLALCFVSMDEAKLFKNSRRSKLATPNLFLGSEPHVRALAWLGVKWENDARFTVVRPMGPTST